jgi:hypothetical protein
MGRENIRRRFIVVCILMNVKRALLDKVDSLKLIEA